MFLLVQTSVGYFDILVNLKTSLKETEDFSCSFYVDESRCHNTQPLANADKKTTETLLCGPILFSSVVSENRMSGQFTVIVPELLNHKSLYIIVKLEHVWNSQKENVTSSSCLDKDIPTNTSCENETGKGPAAVDLIADILKDVYVGVYQFKGLLPNDFYFPGCRNILIKDAQFQENLVCQFIELVEQNADVRDGYEIKMILELLVWITSVHVYSTVQDR